MRITPLDIRKQPFPRALRGFDPDAVNSFLEMVAGEYEAIIRQNSEFGTQIKTLEQKLESYIKIERVLNETLLSAQKATDEARVNAQKEAELILKDAKIRADRYEDEARQRVHKHESELVSLRNQRDSFLARFKAMLSTQLNLLEVISGDLKQGSEEKGGVSEQYGDDETMDEVPPQPNLSSLDS
ncbi:DivIVA domain-containing protein [Chitinispirillales bacterium ANBcel5]|uniref:DivIVA domain-containing protein n=1 Tax=Cellulosispirillum alkaliphilum TaxID=3039283 RepID=UPI002A56224C|nr:DivIVA domain-containing protein [Chitinispirillales bacterium ANBcel5]